MADDMKYTVFYTDENGQLVPNGEKLLSITEQSIETYLPNGLDITIR